MIVGSAAASGRYLVVKSEFNDGQGYHSIVEVHDDLGNIISKIQVPYFLTDKSSYAMALEDNDLIIIGVPIKQFVLVYRYNYDIYDYQLVQTIEPEPSTAGHPNFGCSVSLSANGSTLAISCPNENYHQTYQGEVYIYERDMDSTNYSKRCSLNYDRDVVDKTVTAVKHIIFGTEVIISAYNNNLLVASKILDINDNTSVSYSVFYLTDEVWVQDTKFKSMEYSLAHAIMSPTCKKVFLVTRGVQANDILVKQIVRDPETSEWITNVVNIPLGERSNKLTETSALAIDFFGDSLAIGIRNRSNIDVILLKTDTFDIVSITSIPGTSLLPYSQEKVLLELLPWTSPINYLVQGSIKTPS